MGGAAIVIALSWKAFVAGNVDEGCEGQLGRFIYSSEATRCERRLER